MYSKSNCSAALTDATAAVFFGCVITGGWNLKGRAVDFACGCSDQSTEFGSAERKWFYSRSILSNNVFIFKAVADPKLLTSLGNFLSQIDSEESACVLLAKHD